MTKDYLVISAGDGTMHSRVVNSLEDAIVQVRLDFEDMHGEPIDEPWVEDLIRNPDEWGEGRETDTAGSGRLHYDGEQCYFQVIEITGIPLQAVPRTLYK